MYVCTYVCMACIYVNQRAVVPNLLIMSRSMQLMDALLMFLCYVAQVNLPDYCEEGYIPTHLPTYEPMMHRIRSMCIPT